MTHVLALAMIVVIVATQWFFTSRAPRLPSHFIGQVTSECAAKIALLAIGLYAPRALGMDMKVATFVTIIAITVSSTVGMMVTMRKRVMSVNTPNDTQ